MTEETGQVTAAETAVTTAATTEAPVGFVNADGSFVEGWQSRLQDESLRTDKTLQAMNLKNIEDFAKSYVHVRKQVPLDKIAIPGVNATDEERNAFHEALGRPPTPEEYVMDVPGENTEDFSEDLIKEAKGIFHGLGFNQKQVGALWEFEKGRVAQMNKAMDDLEEREKSEAETALRNRWGTAYDENLHLVNRMVSENASEGEEMDYLLAEYGNNPRLANFLGNVAKKFIEHKIITDIETPSANTEAKITELMNSPAYKDPNFTDRAEHKRVVAQVYALREQLVKMQKTG